MWPRWPARSSTTGARATACMAYSLTSASTAAVAGRLGLRRPAGWTRPTRGYARLPRRAGTSARLHAADRMLLRASAGPANRQVVGDYVLTLDDLFVTCAAAYHRRAQSLRQPRATTSPGHQARVWVDVTENWKAGMECDLPYRCLLPRDRGLLVPGAASRRSRCRAGAAHAERHAAHRRGRRGSRSANRAAGRPAGVDPAALQRG